MLKNSKARRNFLERPGVLVRAEGRRECRFLGLCHGGCPVRAYTVYGNLGAKDPYCETHKAIFNHMEAVSSELAMRRSHKKKG